MRAVGYVAAGALLLTALTGCGGDDSPEGGPTTPTGRPSATATTGSASSTSSPSPSGSTTADEAPSGGTSAQPAVLEPATKVLDWTRVAGPVRDTVTRSGDWTLTVTGNGRDYALEGPQRTRTTPIPGTTVSDALIDEDWAVVVLQDRAEQHPSTAEVTDLASGETFRLDARSDVPTTNGGTWALHDGRLVHATFGPRRSYCLATVDLEQRTSERGWCAPARHGFSQAHLTPGGDSLLTFDDSQPSCRTVVSLEGDRATPFPGVPDCKGWDGLLTTDGAVWSVIPRENRIEEAHFYAREGDGWFDLGPGTAGSLVWCADAAYFVRDPQHRGDPAALLRWSAEAGLSVAYESPAGQAFLSEPRCGGRTLTVTALAEGGDEQVTARLP